MRSSSSRSICAWCMQDLCEVPEPSTCRSYHTAWCRGVQGCEAEVHTYQVACGLAQEDVNVSAAWRRDRVPLLGLGSALSCPCTYASVYETAAGPSECLRRPYIKGPLSPTELSGNDGSHRRFLSRHCCDMRRSKHSLGDKERRKERKRRGCTNVLLGYRRCMVETATFTRGLWSMSWIMGPHVLQVQLLPRYW